MGGAELAAMVSAHPIVELHGVVMPRAAAQASAEPMAVSARPAIAAAARGSPSGRGRHPTEA
jgi:hypothetical protein